MDVEIHPNAKKHLTRGWLIIHAPSPVQKKFWQEIERARQRGR